MSVRAVLEMFTGPMNWQPTGQLVTSLRDGTPAFDSLFGAPYFAVLERDPQAAATFHRAMASITQVFEFLIATELDLPEHGTVVDVGGGFGGLLLAILRRHPGLRGILFDRPPALASHQLDDLGAADRWELVAGDFFGEVPGGADIYVLKGILHDWSDEQCVTILRNCRRAMAPGARILIIEAVIMPGNAGTDVKALDVMMMGLLPGRERTEDEFASMLDAAGLRLVQLISTNAPLSTIEAVAA